VADVRPGDHRHPETAEPLGQDLLDGRWFAAAGERPGHDPGDAVQVAGPAQLREHAVQPVLGLVLFLDEQDAAPGRPRRVGAERRRQQRQVAAERHAARGSARQPRGHRVADLGGLLRVHQRSEHRAERVVDGRAGRHEVRAQQRGPAELAGHRLEHGRHVRVAGQHLRRQPGEAVPVHGLQGALRTGAADGEDDARDGGVAQCGPQIGRAHPVVPGQVAAHAALIAG